MDSSHPEPRIMNDDRVLNLFLQRNGRDLIAQLAESPQWKDELSRLVKLSNINTALSLDLLTHLLGYCWRDAYRLAQVCKRLVGIVAGTAFWMKGIRDSLHLPAWLTPYQRNFFERYFTPFVPNILSTRRDQLGWLFSGNTGWTQESDKHWTTFAIRYRQYAGFWTCEHHGIFVSRQNIDNGKIDKTKPYSIVRVYGDHSAYVGLVYAMKRFDSPFIDNLEWVDNIKGLHWRGEGIYNERSVPHGIGTWTFSDGTTLTGKVAFDGHVHDGVNWFAGEPMSKCARLDE